MDLYDLRSIARTRLKARWNAADKNNECKAYASRSLNREGRKVLRRIFEVGSNSISRFGSHGGKPRLERGGFQTAIWF